MFETFLESIPKNRSLMVNDLELPEDITLTPYIWAEPEESLTVRSDSALSGSIGEYDVKTTASTDSSMPLSRAMTDSEIDYGRYRRVSAGHQAVTYLQKSGWDLSTDGGMQRVLR